MIVIDPALFSLPVLWCERDHRLEAVSGLEVPVRSLASECTESSAIFRMIEKILIVIDQFRGGGGCTSHTRLRLDPPSSLDRR